jgi:hypothetical protein
MPNDKDAREAAELNTRLAIVAAVERHGAETVEGSIAEPWILLEITRLLDLRRNI